MYVQMRVVEMRNLSGIPKLLLYGTKYKFAFVLKVVLWYVVGWLVQ